MTQVDEDRIRLRAHQLWVEEGHPEGRDAEHWAKAVLEIEGGQDTAGSSDNQGEGNIVAGRAYDKHAREFVKSGRVAAKAKEAKKAVEGSEGPALKEAEKVGKSHAHSKDV